MANARFINSGALTGAENMAVDTQLMEQVGAGAKPALRLYAWIRPTLSLGYFQKLEDVADAEYLRRHGIDVVRRPTGGGAILHDQELTFSLALPASHEALRGSILDSYLKLTRPLLEFLRTSGIDAKFRSDGQDNSPTKKAPNCFAGAACPDIVVAEKKVFGSAQRRKGQAVLMHGSLLLGIDEALWQGVYKDNTGMGFAAVSLPGMDWELVLKEIYGRALGLNWQESGATV